MACSLASQLTLAAFAVLAESLLSAASPAPAPAGSALRGVPQPRRLLEGEQVSDEEFCATKCQEAGFCCNDPKIGSNQMVSCAQACMMRHRGATFGEMDSSAGGLCNRNGSSGCSLVHKGTTYKFCQNCKDLTQGAKCSHGVPDKSACDFGAALLALPSPVCDPRKEEAGCPTGMECCDDGSGSPKYPGTTGRCYDPSTHVCFGGNYGNQVKHGICEIGMNSCLGKCYDGPDELCCKGGYMNQESFVLSNSSMTCCNGLDGHYECAPGAKCMKEGYKAWCEAAAPEQPKDPFQCRYTRGKPCTEQKDCGVGCGSCEGGHCVVPDKGFCGRPCTTLTEEQDCGGIGTNTCSYCDGYFCTR